MRLAPERPVWDEFVVTLRGDPEPVLAQLKEEGILAGLPLKGFYPELEKEVLVCVTEKNSRADIDSLASGLRGKVGP